MRRILPLFALSILVFTTSCTREFICQCVIKYEGNPPGIPDSSTVEFKMKDKKKDAASKCEANSTSGSKDGINFSEKCRLY